MKARTLGELLWLPCVRDHRGGGGGQGGLGEGGCCLPSCAVCRTLVSTALTGMGRMVKTRLAELGRDSWTV